MTPPSTPMPCNSSTAVLAFPGLAQDPAPARPNGWRLFPVRNDSFASSLRLWPTANAERLVRPPSHRERSYSSVVALQPSSNVRRPFASHYQDFLDQPRTKTPSTVWAYALEVSGGKFTLSYGTLLAVEGGLSGTPSLLGTGLGVAALGAALFVAGALQFSAAVKRIDRTMAIRLKMLAITGGSFLIGGYACKGAVASGRVASPFNVQMVGSALEYTGLTLMVGTFTSFFVSGQAVYGAVASDPLRKNIGTIMLATGLSMGKLVPNLDHPSRAASFGLLLLQANISLYQLIGAALVLGAARPLWFHLPTETPQTGA